MQLLKPALQEKPHAPLEHVAPAFAGVGQALPQPPQCATVVRVLVSQPSVGLPLQSPKPMLHAKLHALLAQVVVALALFGQTFPQKPQFCGSEAGVDSHPSGSIPLQLALPAAHTAMHDPAEQTPVAEGYGPHALPHVPQLAGSFDVFTQALPHLVVPPVH